MAARIPVGAFEHYVSLGNGRSYDLVANHFGVTKRAVTKAASRERWSERLTKIERDAQARIDEKLTESLEQMHLRHTKMLRAMASRAVKALQEYPLESGMEGLRAAEAVIKLERLVAGEVTERGASSVEVLIRNEYDQIMRPVGETLEVEESSSGDSAADADSAGPGSEGDDDAEDDA
jgi:hypothetical protein